MPKVNGVDITQPESGGGGGFTNALMGIFRERTRAQQQLNMMAYGSALDVAAKAAETEITADIGRKALVKDFKTIYKKRSKDVLYPEGHPRAGQVKHKAGDFVNPELAQHVSEAGLEATPYGYRFSPSSLTKVEKMRRGVGEFEQYKATAPSQANVTTGAKKPRGSKKVTAAQPVETNAPVTPMVNESPQTIVPANTGNRAPEPSKGGFTQLELPFKKPRAPRTPKAKPAGGTTPSSGLGMGEMPSGQ